MSCVVELYRRTYFTMNKLLIVLLAVCLVSTHAFVKRDAPAETSSLEKQLADLQAQILALTKNVSDQTAAVLNPENIKKNLNEAVDKIKEALDKINPAPAKPAA